MSTVKATSLRFMNCWVLRPATTYCYVHKFYTIKSPLPTGAPFAMIRLSFAILGCVIAMTSTVASGQNADKPKVEFAIALHGGAGAKPLELTAEGRKELEAGLAKALEAG